MKSLDEILSERANSLFKQKLNNALDINTWTAANRDKKMSEIREVNSSVAEEAVKFAQEMIDTMIDGKSLLYWKVLTELITAEVSLLMTFREELDTQSRDNLAELPVSYEWLNNTIHDILQTLTNIAIKIDDVTSNKGVSEEI